MKNPMKDCSLNIAHSFVEKKNGEREARKKTGVYINNNKRI